MSGQSIVDRLNAAKHTVAGSALGRAVVKATTEEIMGPKRKHLDYLLQCTSEINVSIPQMADLLIERTQNTSWVVTYKALITIHHLMCFGNERFSQYMASHSSKFVLNNFMDRTGAQGIDMSSYIRKYAFYLNEKRETYKLMGFDFCKVKRGKDDGLLRTMNTEKLLKTLPILQKQVDALIQFDVQPNELTNGVISSSFILLSKDLIRLFACYNDGIINLLEKFFDMNKKNCREALEIYKKFLERTDSVAAFLKVAESSGMDKGDIPDLTKAPSSLLEALESHVNSLEGKKGTNGTSSTASAKASSAVNSAISSLNNNTQLSAEEKRRIVEEEAKTLEAFKSNHLKKQTSLSSPTSELNGFQQQKSATSSPPPPSSSSDLFGLDLTAPTNGLPKTNGTSSSANDDLLQLSGANPFIQNIVTQSYASQPVNMANPFQSNTGMMMGMMPQQTVQQPMGMFQQPMGNSMFPAMTPNNQHDLNPFGAFMSQAADGSGQLETSRAKSNEAIDRIPNYDASGYFSSQISNTNNSSISASNLASSPVNQNMIDGGGGGGSSSADNKQSSNNNLNNFNSATASSKNTAKITANFDFSEFDAFGDVLQPTNQNSGQMNQKQSNGNLAEKSQDSKILSKDLDSSLAQLADNLDINNKNKTFGGKNHQWNPNQQQNQGKTGGQNWKPGQAPAPMGAAWGAAPAPMIAPSPMVAAAPMGANWMNQNANPFGAPMTNPQMVNPMMMQAKPAGIPPQPMRQTANPFDLL